MATTNDEKKVELKKVDELGGYVTSERAAEILGLAVASMHGLILSGKLEAVKFGAMNAVKLTSVHAYKASIADRQAKVEAEKRASVMKALDEMTDDQIQAYLARRQNGK